MSSTDTCQATTRLKADGWIKMARQGWKRRKAHDRMRDFVQAVGKE